MSLGSTVSCGESAMQRLWGSSYARASQRAKLEADAVSSSHPAHLPTPSSARHRLWQGTPTRDRTANRGARRFVRAERGRRYFVSSSDSPVSVRPLAAALHLLAHRLSTPLNEVRGLRAHVLKTLSNRKTIGVAKVEQGGVQAELEDGSMSSFGGTDGPDRPTEGTLVPIRLCDWYAWALQSLDDAPKFQLYWSTQKRDQALVRLRAFVTRIGSRKK